AKGRAEAFMDRARELGFDWLEVSEGTIDLDDEGRDALIALARRRGFNVITEIGKKDRRAKLAVEAVPERMRRDLDGGAEFVIVEGRDSGVGVGVYDDNGVADKAMVDAIMASAPDPSKLIWEAPKVAQQQAFLLALGPNANFGNVQPEDVITLEATRQGLRGDTLRQALLQIAEK
ncbi:MAG TPA: phosphosulfolactate synthase, partial [Limnochordia bacterium]|nr:phosphosulfolactate synthase [Limnochordia bacterium]